MLSTPRPASRARAATYAPLSLIAALLLTAFGSIAQASVYYNMRVVASTDAGNFTGFGVGPSINDKGKVAFVAQYAGGNSISVWDPVLGLSDIASNLLSPNRSFGNSAEINHNDEVVAWDRTLSAAPIGEVRVFRSDTPNVSTVMVRALPGFFANGYDSLFQYPAIDNSLALEDDSQGGNLNGVCDQGEVCVSRVAFGAFRVDVAQRLLGTVVKTPQAGSDFGTFNEFTLNTSNMQPMMADDGSVVIRGNLPTNPILLFAYNLATSKQIAGAADGFTALGNAPGITPDAKIVAFAGNRGNGDGVFLSILEPSGNRRIVRIVGENAGVPKEELGHDASLDKLYFSSIQLDSRVGIIYTPDAAGNPNGSVVVSFIGTPNAASRTNPSTGRPWTFTSQMGIFTIRIDLDAQMFQDAAGNQVCVTPVPGSSTLPAPVGDDITISVNGSPSFIAAGPNGICDTPNDDRTDTFFTRTSPIPVVQIGDTIYNNGNSYVVSALSVNIPLAQANVDALGVARTEHIGDHRVAFWVQAGAKQLIVWGEHLDSDQDGLLDHWETQGIDLTGNGHIDVDLPAMGADPFVRDLFVQMDFTQDRPTPLNPGAHHAPAPTVLRRLSDFFANAPSPAPGIPVGITLHVDAGAGIDPTGQPYSRNMHNGSLHGGNTISGPNNAPVDILYKGLPGSVNLPHVTALDFDTVKSQNFWNGDSGGREFAFLYIVMTDFHHALDANVNDDNANPLSGTATDGNLFALFDANHQFQNFGGNGIIITSGTGAGQLRRITASGVKPGTNIGQINVTPDFDVPPDNTSTYMLFDGSGGEGHATFNNDGSFGPGKSLAVTSGAFPNFNFLDPNGNTVVYTGNVEDVGGTLAHEIGHLVTLKHGGTNHDNYKPQFVSLMNYAYELCPAGQMGAGANGQPLPGAAACPIEDYSGAADKVFYDWGHVNFGSSENFATVGLALGDAPDVNPVFPPPPETLTEALIEQQFGPPDMQSPTVAVTAPASGASVAIGNGFQVTFNATDNVGVTNAKVTFDVNGDGVIDEATEEFPAAFLGGSAYVATIPAVSGPNGARTALVYAFDAAHNPGVAAVSVNVGAVALISVPNVVGLTQAAASSAIKAAGLVVGTVTQQSSNAVPSGNVISENPAAGAKVAAGSSVNLVVSSGPLTGDVNGDGVVNCTDMAIVKAAFGKKTGQAGFDARADLNKDGVVNVVDLSIVSRALPAGLVCH